MANWAVAPKSIDLAFIESLGEKTLAFGCTRCPRFGRYNLNRLIRKHGAGMTLPVLKEILSKDCAKHQAANVYDRCGIYQVETPAWKAYLEQELNEWRERKGLEGSGFFRSDKRHLDS